MEAKAVGRYLRVPPRKARLVLDEVRGKSANEALAMLKFVPNRAAQHIRQIIESAIANAEHNYAMDREILRISRAYVDQGPSLKRIQPRAMGRAYRILKRTSHITVILSEDESLRKVVQKTRGKRADRGKKETVAGASARAEKRPRATKAETKPEKPAEPEVEAPAPTAEAENVETAPEQKEE